MDLADRYRLLYDDAVKKIAEGRCELDRLIDSPSDNRMGITLVARPGDEVLRNIRPFLRSMQSIDPGQYYYPDSDIHITVLSIISCYSGFDVSRIAAADYISLIEESLSGIKSFEVDFTGITASPSCIMIQGFPRDSALQSVRKNLRSSFRTSQLEHSIDKRYPIQTFHSTVIRFKEKLLNTKEYLRMLDGWRTRPFGLSTIDSLELVLNDWYQRTEKSRLIKRFTL